MVLPAGGRGIFSPVYVDNLVDGIAAAAASPAGAGQVFTITDGVGLETRAFFGRYAAILGVRSPPGLPTRVVAPLAAIVGRIDRLRGVSTETNAATAAYLARRGTYSIEKARRVLGYAPAVGLDEGFARTTRWLRSQGMLA
jgi:nucleoside-diphosphate-sugar epimerase